MERVTARQQEFVDFIKNFEEKYGCPPTFREIALGMGISSKGSVSAMVNMLHSMGLVDKAEGSSRGTRTRQKKRDSVSDRPDPVQVS